MYSMFVLDAAIILNAIKIKARFLVLFCHGDLFNKINIAIDTTNKIPIISNRGALVIFFIKDTMIS